MRKQLDFSNTNVSLEDYDLALEAIVSNNSDISNLNESNERLLSIITALESIESAKIANSSISLESIDLISNLSIAGTNLPADYFMSSQMSLEDIVHKKSNAVMQFFQNIGVTFSKIADNAHYYNTAFNFQRSRLNSVKKRIGQLPNATSLTISTGINKYVQLGAGEDTVTDFKEYVKAYKEMADVMTNLNSSLSDLAEDDLFTTLKMIKDFFKGDSDKYFKDRFLSLQSTMDGVKKSTGLKVESRRPVSTEYASNVLLGLSQVVLAEPNKNTYDLKDQKSLVDAHKHFYLYIERLHKVKVSNMLTGSIKLDVDKKSIEEIINATSELLDSANSLNSYGAKLSTYQAGGQYGALAITALRDDDSDQVIMAYTRAGKILNRISAILYDSVASSYNFSLGNIKKALTISEAFLDKAE